MDGQTLLETFSTFMNDRFSSTTTAAGAADGTTVVDDELKKWGDRRLIGRTVRITSGDNAYDIRTISNNTASSGTITVSPGFDAQVATSVTYEIHRYSPLQKFRALEEARYDAADDVFKLVQDETLTADGSTHTFPTPSTMRLGPIQVYVENPVPCQNMLWNFISDAIGDSISNWTATSCTATVNSVDYTDLIIPKYDYSSTQLVIAASTAATYKQAVADMANDITATKAAGRTMTFGMWVYCKAASRVTLTFEDDSGSTSSSAHGGLGWELLTVEKDITGNNATTLTVGIAVSSAAAPLTIHWNRAWLYFGKKERITENYLIEAFPTVRRDFDNQTFTLNSTPSRGRQLRVVGQELITSLGTDPALQPAATTEVDEETARVLCSAAAQLLLEWEGITAADAGPVMQRMANVAQRVQRTRKFNQSIPRKSVVSPYWTQ